MTLPLHNGAGTPIEDKKCNCCGQQHTHIPEDAPVEMDLYWWNCECGSTLVYPKGE